MRKKINNIPLFAILTAVLCLTFIRHAEADYQSTVLADSPLLYFRFEDSNMADEAPVADLGSVGRGGTYISKGGMNSISPVVSAPCLNQASYLGQTSTYNGDGDCIDIWDVNNDFSLPDVTYEIWMKSDEIAQHVYPRVFQYNGDKLRMGGPGLMMFSKNDVPPIGEYGIIGGDLLNFIVGPTDDEEWHHIVATYDSNDAGPGPVLKELYVDGVSIGTAFGPNNLRYEYDHITIGADGNLWWLFDKLKGSIDEFAIYEGILSSDRITAHYNAGIGSDGDGDGIPGCIDNCPDVYNPDQADSDEDNIGDECECETANLDGTDPVNFKDFAILGQGWLTKNPGDTNRDGDVDMTDLLQVVEHWLDECNHP